MQTPPITKYRPWGTIDLPDRKWPGKVIDRVPIWCSVDLRDGNQALPIPMGVDQKLELFDLLAKIGFKEIEVGFPSAAQTEFDFARKLIDEDRVPEGVALQVLTQAREHLIRRTFESLKGAKKAIVHVYNSTSPLQRRVTFGMSKEQIKQIAVDGVKLVRDLLPELDGTEVRLEYSPESFSDTEVDYSLEVCEAVMEAWGPCEENPIILNLPATVELFTPNVHADQIEWFCRNLKERNKALISLHTHNDRGTGTAATELGLLAGADRVEGTLFGNGERTGNLDVVTAALNMYAQGLHPGLDFSDMDVIRETYERTTGMTVHERHPYGGDLVFTAFSGSHQDAIKKGFKAIKESNNPKWEVPYLPIDPADLGRSYEAVVRINSQSGKGGVAFLLEKDHGVSLPRRLQISLSQKIQKLADKSGKEISSTQIWDIFEENYLKPKNNFSYIEHESSSKEDIHSLSLRMNMRDSIKTISGTGNGPIDSFVNGLSKELGINIKISDYHQSAISSGSDAQAAAYIELEKDGQTKWGVGINPNTTRASFEAIIVGLSKIL